MKIKKNILLISLSLGYLFLIIVSYLLKPDTAESVLAGTSGDLIISAFSGVVFFFIGLHFQKENDEKIDGLHNDLVKDISRQNYNRMISFLKSGETYNFFLPDYKMSDGSWFSYSMKGRNEGDDALAFSTRNNKEFVIYVDDISYRDVLDKAKLAEYVYGPLQVGNCYFISFRDGKMFLDCDSEGMDVEICWRSSGIISYSRPSANSLYFPNPIEGATLLDSFIYNREGEEANSGWSCEIYQRDNQILLRLAHKGELKRVIVTFEDGDYLKESPYIKIEKIEGYFLSVSALNNF